MSSSECADGIYKICPDDIERIYIGCNAGKEVRKLVIKLNQEKKIPFTFLSLHKREYKLIPSTIFDGDISTIVDTQYNLFFDRDKR